MRGGGHKAGSRYWPMETPRQAQGVKVQKNLELVATNNKGLPVFPTRAAQDKSCGSRSTSLRPRGVWREAVNSPAAAEPFFSGSGPEHRSEAYREELCQLLMQLLILLPQPQDGLPVLLDVPLGALVVGLPVTLCRQHKGRKGLC